MIQYVCNLYLEEVITMYISGYHGTSLVAAQSIVNDKKFEISCSDKEWLGNGIYFYFEINDAMEWRDSEAIIHTIIQVNEDDYLDLDTDEGKKIIRRVKEHLKKEYALKLASDSVQKNQCAIMKTIWTTNSNISVMEASFPKEPSIIKTLLDEREKRREFCVRDNAPLIYMHSIVKERLFYE